MSARVISAGAVLLAVSAAGFAAYLGLRDEPPEKLLPLDESMFEVSAATGGDFYFWEPGEFASSALRIPVGADENLVLAYGQLDGRPRRLGFPVESRVRTLEVFAGAQWKDDFRLLSPSGNDISVEENADVQVYTHMLLATVQAPEPGEWRLELAGAGRFSASARGKARGWDPEAPEVEPIELIDVSFVELRGRPGHEGYFEVEGPLRAGSEGMIEVVLSGSFDTATLGFVSGDGTPLGEPRPLAPIDEHERGRFLQPVVIPRVPFRVVVGGRDLSGAPYQRVDSPLRDPAPKR